MKRQTLSSFCILHQKFEFKIEKYFVCSEMRLQRVCAKAQTLIFAQNSKLSKRRWKLYTKSIVRSETHTHTVTHTPPRLDASKFNSIHLQQNIVCARIALCIESNRNGQIIFAFHHWRWESCNVLPALGQVVHERTSLLVGVTSSVFVCVFRVDAGGLCIRHSARIAFTFSNWNEFERWNEWIFSLAAKSFSLCTRKCVMFDVEGT